MCRQYSLDELKRINLLIPLQVQKIRQKKRSGELGGYPYSSYNAYITGNKGDMVARDPNIGDTLPAKKRCPTERYRAYMEDPLTDIYGRMILESCADRWKLRTYSSSPNFFRLQTHTDTPRSCAAYVVFYMEKIIDYTTNYFIVWHIYFKAFNIFVCSIILWG